MGIATLTQLILLGVTLASFDTPIHSSSHQIPHDSHFMNDLSPKMPIHLPKITILVVSSSVCYRRASRPTSTVYFQLALLTSHGPRALSLCMPAPLVLSCAPFCLPFLFYTCPTYVPSWTLYVLTHSTSTRVPSTPLAGLLSPLVTRCSPSPFHDGKQYSCLHMMLAHCIYLWGYWHCLC